MIAQSNPAQIVPVADHPAHALVNETCSALTVAGITPEVVRIKLINLLGALASMQPAPLDKKALPSDKKARHAVLNQYRHECRKVSSALSRAYAIARELGAEIDVRYTANVSKRGIVTMRQAERLRMVPEKSEANPVRIR